MTNKFTEQNDPIYEPSLLIHSANSDGERTIKEQNDISMARTKYEWQVNNVNLQCIISDESPKVGEAKRAENFHSFAVTITDLLKYHKEVRSWTKEKT